MAIINQSRPIRCGRCRKVVFYAVERLHIGATAYIAQLRRPNGTTPKLHDPARCPHCGADLGAGLASCDLSEATKA